MAQRIQAKWNIDSLQYHEEYQGMTMDTTEVGQSTDYFDIRSDNKIYISSDVETDTLDYTLKNDSTLIVKNMFTDGDDTLKIRALTDNSLKLYTKETDSSNTANFLEATFNLKK